MNSKRIDDSNCGHEEFCQSLRPGDRDCNCEKAQEDSEVSRLRELASVCYAGLVAECNLPDTWADVFLAASQGEPFTTEELLPFTYQSPQPRGDMVLDASIIREAAEVLEAVGTSGVPLPENWRWPLADELSGIAALAAFSEVQS